MRREYHFYVYIVASHSRRLYIGMTNALLKRIKQHREGTIDGFTKKYKIHRLVYFEEFQYVNNAIAREKQLKGCLREKKIALIVQANPTWEDLYPLMLKAFETGVPYEGFTSGEDFGGDSVFGEEYVFGDPSGDEPAPE